MDQISLLAILLLVALALSGCSTPPAPPAWGNRAGTTLLKVTGDIAGFGAKNWQDVKLLSYVLPGGISGNILEIDNRPILSGTGLPLITSGTSSK